MCYIQQLTKVFFLTVVGSLKMHSQTQRNSVLYGIWCKIQLYFKKKTSCLYLNFGNKKRKRTVWGYLRGICLFVVQRKGILYNLVFKITATDFIKIGKADL